MKENNQISFEDYFLYFLVLVISISLPAIFISYFFIDDHAVILDKFSKSNLSQLFNLSDKTIVRTLINWVIFKINGYASTFRFVTIISHVFSSFLVFKNIKEIELRIAGKNHYEDFYYFLLTLLFALHPSHIESLVWVSSARTIWAIMFVNLSLFTYLKFNQTRMKKFWAGSYLFWILAVLTKPSVAPFVLVFSFLEWSLAEREFEKKNLLNFVALGLISVFGIVYVLDLKLVFLQDPKIDFVQRFIFGCHLFGLYFQKMFFPSLELLDYKQNLRHFVTHLSANPLRNIFVSLLFFVFCLALSFRYFFVKNSLLSFTVICTSLLIVPFLGIIPFDFEYASSFADRYLGQIVIFLPLLALIVLNQWPKMRFFLPLPILIFLVMSVINSYHWTRPAQLFEASGFKSIVTENYLMANSQIQKNCEDTIKHSLNLIELRQIEQNNLIGLAECLGPKAFVKDREAILSAIQNSQIKLNNDVDVQRDFVTTYNRKLGDWRSLESSDNSEDLKKAKALQFFSYLMLIDYYQFIESDQLISKKLIDYSARYLSVTDELDQEYFILKNFINK